MADQCVHAMVTKMDGDAKRELDLVWKHGVEPLRDDIKAMRKDIREDLKQIHNTISNTRKLVITTLVTAVPAWVGLYITVTRK